METYRDIQQELLIRIAEQIISRGISAFITEDDFDWVVGRFVQADEL